MPRKTHRRRLAGDAGRRASMRPRPDAAENTDDDDDDGDTLASMRPRPDAAENFFFASPLMGSDLLQ